jgi:hypothetical protein
VVRTGAAAQAIEQRGEAIHFGFDQRGEFAAGRVVGDAAREQLRGALQSRERIAQFVRESLQRGGQGTRQQLRGILAGEFIDRMRFDPPAARLARGQGDIGEARRVAAGEGEGNAAQARAVERRIGERTRESIAFELERRQRNAGQALRAHAEPACAGRIRPFHAAIGAGPGDGGGEQVEGEGAV